MANWFKCPKCGQMIEQGQVKEIKDRASAGTVIGVGTIMLIAGAIFGFGMGWLSLTLID